VNDTRARVPLRLRVRLIVGAGIVIVAVAVWAALTYWGNTEEKAEVVAYRLCVAADRSKCPPDASFVRNQGEDTVTRWAQGQCASYKRRRIIVSDGPADCNCTIADVTCASE
jgi:hypothetical protein